MRPITKSLYTVEAGEVVSVEIVPSKVDKLATMTLDGRKLNPVTEDPLTYSFAVTVLEGESHSIVIDCRFPSNASHEARFNIRMTGSFGGGIFHGQDIARNDSPPYRRVVQFQHSNGV